ncbi:MAG: DUF1858 domain-containing protein [Rhodothermales bacterium]
MASITSDMKVARVIQDWPDTVEVFFSHGCPDMRAGFFGIMARVMSVRNAARMHRIPLDRLLSDLNRAAAAPSKEVVASEEPA